MAASNSTQTGLDRFNATTEVGDRVTDTVEPDEQPAMRVVDPDVGSASEVTVEGAAVANHDDNGQFPDDDRVVKVVYEDALGRLVRGWEEMLGERFSAELEAYESEWGVSVDRYHFPASRLATMDEAVVEKAGEGTAPAVGGESA
jgi:hypothetical protein